MAAPHPIGAPSGTTGQAAGRSLDELVGDWRDASILGSSPASVRRAAAVVRRFIAAMGIRSAGGIDASAVAVYLGRLRAAGAAEKTICNHRSALSGFCACLVARGLLARDPTRDVPVRRPAAAAPRWLDEAELATALSVADAAGVGPEVRLALATGLRLAELARLRWGDVDVARRQLLVRLAKGRRPRAVPLSAFALAALAVQRERTGGMEHVFPARRTWRGGWRWLDRPRSDRAWIDSLAPVRLAVKKFRDLPGKSTGRAWHLLRHTFASRAAQAGVSLYKLAAWLGHRDIRTTELYSHLCPGYDEDIERASPPVETKGASDGQLPLPAL